MNLHVICAYAFRMSRSALDNCTLSAMHLPMKIRPCLGRLCAQNCMSWEKGKRCPLILCPTCRFFSFYSFCFVDAHLEPTTITQLTSLEQVLYDIMTQHDQVACKCQMSARAKLPASPCLMSLRIHRTNYCTSAPPLVEIPSIAAYLIMQYLV